MTGEQIVSLLFENFGWSAFIVAILLLIIFWAIVHGLAEPGKKISYLRGLVSYTKKYQRARDRKKPMVINVIEEGSNTLWRIVYPVKDWIDGDINDYSDTYISNILIGPFHARLAMLRLPRILRRCTAKRASALAPARFGGTHGPGDR